MQETVSIMQEADDNMQKSRNTEIEHSDLEAPIFIAFQLTNLCNLRCSHCCEDSAVKMQNEMTDEEIDDFLNQIVDMKIPYVAISGGEAMMHPRIFDILNFLSDHNISVKMETNGEYITDANVAKKFAALKTLRAVQISIDGATPETHNKLRIRGDWNKPINAIKLLGKEGVNREIVFVPTKWNIHEIGQMIDLAYSMDVFGIYTGRTMRIGRAAFNWDRMIPSPEQYQKLDEVIIDRMKKYNGKMKVYNFPYDVVEELKYRARHPAASLLIIPNGKCKLIGPLPHICGELRKHSLKQLWFNYQRAWKDERVQDFVKEIAKDNRLLAQSNNWRELGY